MKMKTLARIAPIVLVLIAASTPATALAQDAADRAWRAGLQAFQANNPAECVTQMRTAIREGGEAYERWGWIHMMLGICLGQRNQRDEAISELQTAKELVSEDQERFQVNHNLAQIYVSRGNSGDYDRAIAAENEAAKYAKDATQRGAVAKTLGQAYYFKEDWNNAIRQLTTAADARTNDASVAQQLGRAYLETGNTAKATEWLQKTLSLDRDNSAALGNLGQLNLTSGNWNEAIRFLEQAIRLDAQNMQLRGFLGRAYLGSRRYNDAIAQLAQVAQARSSDGNAHYNLGLAYFGAGRDAEAIDAYTAALSHLPSGSSRGSCLYDLGFVYEKVGRFEDSLQAFEDSVALRPDAKTTEAIERVKERLRRQKEGSGS